MLARADRTTRNRINRLIDNALRDLSTCIGKRNRCATCWRRLVTADQRRAPPVYLVVGDGILVLQARFHHT